MSGHFLDRFMAPRSIAIIGASRDTGKISARPLRYLKKHRYAGRLYPVNPRYSEIEGLRCYANLADVPESIDLAIIVVAAKRVLEILEQCAACGVGYAAVFSSGFAETGGEGKRLQDQIKALCGRTNLRVMGPNAQGFFNLHNHTAAAFSSALDLDNLLTGDLGFVSQSGAFGFSTFCLGQEAGLGFSHVVATGNEADLCWFDIADYMVDDPRTRTIAAYVEGFRDGARLPCLAGKALDGKKPLIVLKVGRTAVGSRAAASHTAAMTGADAIFDAVCRQYGVIRVRDVADIFDLARAFSPRKRAAGKRLGIITTSGGAGVMAADEAVEIGLTVEPLTEATQQAIKDFIPAFGAAQNPVDVTAEVLRNPETFRETLARVLQDETIDQLAILLTMVTGDSALERAKEIAAVCAASPKPVAISWSASEAMAGPAKRYLREANMPLFPTPVRAVRALKAVSDFSAQLSARENRTAEEVAVHTAPVPRPLRARLSAGESLNEYDAKRLLGVYGIPTVREQMVDSPEAAVEAAEAIGYPAALKVVSPDIQHKTQAGGVRLGLDGADAVRTAVTDMQQTVRQRVADARIEGFLVQQMVVGGTEMIAGIIQDPAFGPTLMLGMGGIFVEIMRDVSYRVAPVDYSQAEAMIAELQGAGVLAGARGQPPRDRRALADALCRLSALALDCREEIRELEINPLIVLPEGEGVCAADALTVAA
jgi:acetyltransferase